MPRPILSHVQLRRRQRHLLLQSFLSQIHNRDTRHQNREWVIVEKERGQVGFRGTAAELVGGMLEGDPMRAGAIQMDSCIVIKLLVQDGCYLMLQERLEAEAGG